MVLFHYGEGMMLFHYGKGMMLFRYGEAMFRRHHAFAPHKT